MEDAEEWNKISKEMFLENSKCVGYTTVIRDGERLYALHCFLSSAGEEKVMRGLVDDSSYIDGNILTVRENSLRKSASKMSAMLYLASLARIAKQDGGAHGS